MRLIDRLILKANNNYDVNTVKELTVKFKKKQHKQAWVTYTYPNRKQLLGALYRMGTGCYPTQPNYLDV